MILSCSNITKAFGTDTILKNISFHIEEQEKAAIVGINGAGKSTLLKIIVGDLPADSGDVVLAKGRTIGYLAQHQDLESDRTIYEEVLEIKRPIIQMEERIRQLEQEMEGREGAALEAMLAEYSRLTHRFEMENGYAYKSEVTGVLKGLGFCEDEFTKKVSTLSGGQKTRISLGKLLLSDPDLILLDEPTNHLDMGSITWLENYLLNYKGSVIIVAHDRYFLNRVVKKIVELDQGQAHVYMGNYDAYSQKRAMVRQAQMKAYLNQQQEIRHQQEVITKLKSFNREKSIRRAESREKMLAKIQVLDKPTEVNDAMSITLEPRIESGNDVLTVRDLSKSFGPLKLFSHVDMDIKRGERVAVIGNNGTGKSTLLKIIMDLLPSDSGQIRPGSKVHVGYYDQEQQVLHMEKTVFDEIQDEYPDMDNTRVRNVLAAFLFTGDDVFKKIADLSGGERGRVSLAKLMLSEANFLILDEPTNHLDITSKEILEDALTHYTGTVLYVSHDRYFINKTATRILELTGQTFIGYLGDYDYYLEKRDELTRTYAGGASALSADGKTAPAAGGDMVFAAAGKGALPAGGRPAPAAAGKTAPAAGNPQKALAGLAVAPPAPKAALEQEGKLDWKAQKEAQARLRKWQNDLKKTEESIHQLETRNTQIDDLLTQEEVYTDVGRLMELNKEKEELEEKLEALYAVWEELAEDEPQI
ncbi:MAG: ABC-F family ATP-binding cassette domain-containing protein [Lachnospiraceae bacterium]|nr:ABC-F family ATP-binding cassette domain-containing protein [Lachnospiraceae bacterium]